MNVLGIGYGKVMRSSTECEDSGSGERDVRKKEAPSTLDERLCGTLSGSTGKAARSGAMGGSRTPPSFWVSAGSSAMYSMAGAGGAAGEPNRKGCC